MTEPIDQEPNFHDLSPADLNPNAKEWNPVYDCAPEQDRCLFLTFSNGYPLSEHQIVTFFTRKFGACIERVYVHCPEGGNDPPLFGKVVFVASSIPAIILEGKEEAKFSIHSKTMWCKKYEARKARTSSRVPVFPSAPRRPFFRNC